MSETKQALPHSISVEKDGKPFEVFMSFALLNRVCYLMGDASQIPMILQDAELREAVLVEAFSERDGKGKVISRPGIDEMTVSFEDIQNVLEFISEHVTDFTVAAVEKASRIMVKQQGRIDAIPKPSSSTSSPTGSENSALKSPAA